MYNLEDVLFCPQFRAGPKLRDILIDVLYVRLMKQSALFWCLLAEQTAVNKSWLKKNAALTSLTIKLRR